MQLTKAVFDWLHSLIRCFSRRVAHNCCTRRRPLRREVKPWGIDISLIYPGGVKTEFGEHAGIKRKTKATTPKFLLLSAEDVGRAVVQLVRHPRAMWIIPWLWSVTALLNKLFPSFVDYTTIIRFTIPEREEELKSDSHVV